MNTARNGRNIKNRTHRVLVTPDTEWSRNRSLKTWNKTMSQMNKKKNHSTDQKMSPNETSATIMVSSLDGWAERNKHRGRGAGWRLPAGVNDDGRRFPRTAKYERTHARVQASITHRQVARRGR